MAEARFSPADWPVPIPTTELVGTLVRLEPLSPSHERELTEAGRDPRTWQFTTSTGATPADMRTYIDHLVHDWRRGAAAPFVVRRLATATVVGCTRLKQLDRNHRHGILGSWYAPSAWRTGVNLEAKLLLLAYAFETLGCLRIEFHTDSRNLRSRTSLERLGAHFEGILRAHQITRNGTLRDSAIYSVLATEWPSVRSGIISRLRI